MTTKLLAGLAAVFFVTTVVLAIVAVGLQNDRDALVDDRVSVQEAAGRFVDTFLDYDYRRPEAIDAVLALTAPPFTEQFEEALPALQESFEAAQQVSTGSVSDVFVAEVEGADATAIVVYDRQLNGAGGPREERNRYLRLSLVERDGGWRVNGVTDLNLAFAGGAATGSTPTSTG